MTRIFSILLIAITCLLVFSSCDDDFETTADFKDIPIVFGLLSLQDTAHYIRVERAFLAKGESAIDVAKIADSIYYDNLTVILEKVDSGEQYFLEEIDGNLDGYEREEGPFAEEPNILYKIKAEDIVLEAGEEVKLIIIRDEDLPEVTSVAEVVGEVRIFAPNPQSRFRITENSTNRISWAGNPQTFFYDVDMYITIREINLSEGIDTLKEFRWKMDRRITNERLNFVGIEFLSFIAGLNLEKSNSINRQITNLRIVVLAGGEAMQEAVNLTLANSGITSTQEVPIFSNIEGGRGIFSSRATASVTGVTLTGESIDVLNEFNGTAGLNFFN